MIRDRWTRAAGIGACVALLSAVAVGPTQAATTIEQPGTQAAQPSADQAMVRYLNASPNAPDLTVYLGGTAVDPTQQLAFGAVSDYLPTKAGSEMLDVYKTGTSPADSTSLVGQDVTFDAGKSYTVAITNDVASPQVHVFTDDAAPVDAKAQLRVIDLAPDTTGREVKPNGADKSLFEGLGFPNATSYVYVDPGTFVLALRDPVNDSDSVHETVNLDKGNSYSIFAIGSAKGEAGAQPLRLVDAVDSAVSSSVRALNAMPNAGPVDVYFDGVKVDDMGSLGFGAVSGYTVVPTGDHDIKVVKTGEDPNAAEPILSVHENIPAGRHWTMVLSDQTGKAAATVLEDKWHPFTDKAELRVAQLSADTPAIDAGARGATPMFKDIRYDQASSYQPVDWGKFDLEIHAANTQNALKEIDALKLKEGASYTAYLIGQDKAGSGSEPLTVVLAQDAR